MATSSRPAAEIIPPQRLILDSGAVLAWSRGNTRTRALLHRALELGVDIRIPVVVLTGDPRDLRALPARHPAVRVIRL